MSVEKTVLDLFKVMVAETNKSGFNLDHVRDGFILDFYPTETQYQLLKSTYKPFDVTTLFSVNERETGNPIDLFYKQVLHYIEVYGLNEPGLFNLESTSGQVFTLAYVKAVSEYELGNLVRTLIYSNAPIKDSAALKEVITHYKIPFAINLIKNNEMRIELYDGTQILTSGDDAVRWIVYNATGNSLLIKSAKVVQAVTGSTVTRAFLQNNLYVLAKVFNRHKKLIMALKNKSNRDLINKISHLSKKHHVPIYEALNKNFINLALNNKIDVSQALINPSITLRDKFKYLNLLQYKLQQNETDAFIIRNGSIHVEPNRPTYPKRDIYELQAMILDSISKDLAHLKGKTIRLDSNVDYGLPISRKQTIGNLPFGTAISVGETISSGIFWDIESGANDLDLSAVDTTGKRVGWGEMSGYTDEEIVFSGDVTYPTKEGVMEFMTSKSKSLHYGLLVNIYSGELGSRAKVVIGTKGKNKWIEDVKIREDILLSAENNIIGFVKNNQFIVYQGKINGDRYSEPDEKTLAIISRGTAEFWTVKKLFNVLNIAYVVDNIAGVDYDLTYNGFTYDKLEQLLIANDLP